MIDPAGHVTTIQSYDADGRITRTTDANGVNTDMTYTSRGWLTSRSVAGATTHFTYTPYGAVASTTDPDGVMLRYTYDAAHRLTDITDAIGNRIHYTLDAAGNKIRKQIYDSNGAVVKSLSRTYNTLGELTAVIDGLNHTVFNAGYGDSYDADGNLVHSADAQDIQRRQSYDALDRLVSTIANYNGTDAATSNTQSVYQYDALDRLAGVSDPDVLSTIYTYNGLGDRTELLSPDTGINTSTYDAAGNRLTHTDAKGITGTSTYDVLNRITSTRYPDNSLDVTYNYDENDAITGCIGSHPIGRLTRIVESTVTTTFCYNPFGRVVQKRQVTTSRSDVTRYSYTAAGRLSTESMPDQTLVEYAYDSDGRIRSVTATPPAGASTAVASQITWMPFGPIKSYTLGNGQLIQRIYDANYRLTDLTSPSLTLHFVLNAMGNIAALGNAPGANPVTETYSYDPLYRLTGVTDGGTVLESYTYNKAGDRLSKTAPGLATGSYLYAAGTHRLTSVGGMPRTSDAVGNTTSNSVGGETFGFTYNDHNRLATVQRDGQTVGTYTYNALGQRIAKVTNFTQSMTTNFAYDESGHLIAEHDTSGGSSYPGKSHGKGKGRGKSKGKGKGKAKGKGQSGTRATTTDRDYIWLGNLPVAIIDTTSGTSIISYVTADQLGTPRVVTDASGATLWKWAYKGNPFGEQAPVSATGYVLNLRYPGQYYDAENRLNYNYFRSNSPFTGRYLQSDPIGLRGGYNTYAYVFNEPIDNSDPSGLKVKVVARDPIVARKLMNAYAYLNYHSATARSIDTDLENSPTIYKIEPTSNMGDDEYCPSSSSLGCQGHGHTVFVDICEFPSIPTTASLKPITLPVLLGHELGHAWGYEDNVTATDPLGDNVRMVENPIRKELGLPLRTRYYLQ